MDKVFVIGTGGLAREFTAFFSSQVEIVGFTSTNKEEYEKYNLPGVFFEGDINPSVVETDQCVIAIGSPDDKEMIGKKFESKGFSFPNLIHASAVVGSNVEASRKGLIISPNCTVGSNVLFGDHVYLNFMVGVGHDCIFKGFNQVNPGVQVGGFSEIGSHVLLGTNSTIRQGLKVGSGATVGSGAVVLSGVRDGLTVLGNPARRLKLPISE